LVPPGALLQEYGYGPSLRDYMNNCAKTVLYRGRQALPS
jgi:hypothetical protein